MLSYLSQRVKVSTGLANSLLRGSGTLISSPTRSNSTKSTANLKDLSAQKAATKKRRTELYNAQQARDEKYRKEGRRNQEKKNFLKNKFRTWYGSNASRQAWMEREAKRCKMGWKLRVGVMLERLPAVTPDEEQWEQDYDTLRFELDQYGPVLPKELKMEDPMGNESFTQEEIEAQFPKDFQLAPRETPADHSGDYQTLERKLKTRVYLSHQKDSIGSWSLPTTTIQNGETFVDGTKRLMKDLVGEEMDIFYLSNCPMAVDYVQYEEKESKDGFFGEKIFYMRVQYGQGDIDSSGAGLNSMHDWGWLSRDEMSERIKEKNGEDASLFYHYML